MTEQINILEGKLQQAANENVKLKVKQNEHSKLWEGLDSKISSTKSLWQLKKPLAENHKFCQLLVQLQNYLLLKNSRWLASFLTHDIVLCSKNCLEGF